jgi:CRP-like cAMP-binding protein
MTRSRPARIEDIDRLLAFGNVLTRPGRDAAEYARRALTASIDDHTVLEGDRPSDVLLEAPVPPGCAYAVLAGKIRLESDQDLSRGTIFQQVQPGELFGLEELPLLSMPATYLYWTVYVDSGVVTSVLQIAPFAVRALLTNETIHDTITAAVLGAARDERMFAFGMRTPFAWRAIAFCCLSARFSGLARSDLADDSLIDAMSTVTHVCSNTVRAALEHLRRRNLIATRSLPGRGIWITITDVRALITAVITGHLRS